MPRHLRLEFPGAIYHVYVRGNARQSIFQDDQDRERFLLRLAESVNSYGIRLYLFCLMTNHYHLLVETPEGNISRFMQSLETGYTVYYNLRHSRSGHLVQGRFGAKLVEGDDYLLNLSRYLHLNPVWTSKMKKLPIKKRVPVLRRYIWSSYPGYVDLRHELDYVDYGPMLVLVGGRDKQEQQKKYRAFVEGGLFGPNEELPEALNESPRAIGSDGFLRWVDKLYRAQFEKSQKPKDILFRNTFESLPVDAVLAVVCEELGIEITELQKHRRNSVNRAVAAGMLWKYCGQTKRAIAGVLGLGSGAAVGWQLKRLDEVKAMEIGSSVVKIISRIEKRLNDLRYDTNID